MTVFAFVEGSPADASVLSYAVWAAQTLGDQLTVVAKAESTDAGVASGFDAYQQMQPREDVFREAASSSRIGVPETDLAAIELAQSAAQKARELGMDRARTVSTPDEPRWFAENATDSHDLLVIARADISDGGRRIWTDVLRTPRRVVLLVPESFATPHRWLAAIDGRPAVGRAVDYLTRHKILRDQPGVAVIVSDDYRSRVHFRDAVKHLRDVGYEITAHELHGNADDVLAATTTILPIDFLVLGARDQSRVRALLEGSTSNRLLRDFSGPVLIARE